MKKLVTLGGVLISFSVVSCKTSNLKDSSSEKATNDSVIGSSGATTYQCNLGYGLIRKVEITPTKLVAYSSDFPTKFETCTSDGTKTIDGTEYNIFRNCSKLPSNPGNNETHYIPKSLVGGAEFGLIRFTTQESGNPEKAIYKCVNPAFVDSQVVPLLNLIKQSSEPALSREDLAAIQRTKTYYDFVVKDFESRVGESPEFYARLKSAMRDKINAFSATPTKADALAFLEQMIAQKPENSGSVLALANSPAQFQGLLVKIDGSRPRGRLPTAEEAAALLDASDVPLVAKARRHYQAMNELYRKVFKENPVPDFDATDFLKTVDEDIAGTPGPADWNHPTKVQARNLLNTSRVYLGDPITGRTFRFAVK